MIVLTLTRPWLLVGYRALGRKWASSGLVSSIGEAVTQAPAGAAFGRPGADRRTWGGQTDVGRARGPPHESCESREGDEARPASYQLPRSSALCRSIVKTMYRWPASSKQTAPLTSNQIRCSRVITTIL